MKRVLAENVAEIDLALFQFIFSRNGKRFWDRFFRTVTRSGDAWAYAIIGFALIFVDRLAGERLILPMLIAFSAELLVYKTLKQVFRRARPFESMKEIRGLIAVPDRYSFPSGHTAAAFVAATVLTVCFPILCLPAFGWASLIGISRIYLGVHYPSDVLAGMVLGLISAQFGLIMSF